MCHRDPAIGVTPAQILEAVRHRERLSQENEHTDPEAPGLFQVADELRLEEYRQVCNVTHPLTVLEVVGLLTGEVDAFHANRNSYRIAKPLITFYHAVMRPVWPELEHSRNLERAWARARKRFDANVLGPHFERLCREWTWYMAPPSLFGDHPNRVASRTVADPANRTSHELDVVALGLADDNSSPLLAIGEAKWNDVIGLGYLDRLPGIKSLLTEQDRPGAADANLLQRGWVH